MIAKKYILDGHAVIEEPDVLRWAQAFEATDRQVVRTDVAEGVEVSTVFLGLDHQWGSGPPLLFETMVFWPGSAHDNDYERCALWEGAERQHDAMVAQVQEWISEARIATRAT
jgi:hypothetical protein